MTKRDRIVLAVLAIVAVLGGSFQLAIKPKREEAADLAEQADQAQVRRDTALASLANAKQARAEFAGAQIAIARMGKAVPTDDDVATIVFQLERTARAAGIDFRSLTLDAAAASTTAATTATPADAAAKTSTTKVPFKLKFEGSFFNLKRFLDHVNGLTRTKKGKYLSVRGRLFTIEGVGLVAGRGGFPSIAASINLVAYSAPAPSATPTAAAGTTAGATGTQTASATPAASTGEAAR